MSTTIDESWVFEHAGGLACKIGGWWRFAANASAGARKEAMTILNASHIKPCAKAAQLKRLMARWAAVLLLLCCMTHAADLLFGNGLTAAAMSADWNLDLGASGTSTAGTGQVTSVNGIVTALT
jgi:hypothetical protein